jgi:hypothetical protein
MYFDDHNPPHFHVIYRNYKAVVAIHDLSLLEGDLPPKAVGLVMEWAKQHKNELWAHRKTHLSMLATACMTLHNGGFSHVAMPNLQYLEVPLLEDWDLARAKQSLFQIDPLE